MLIDTHCHLDFPDFAPEQADIVARAQARGVGRMITISTHVTKFAAIAAIAERYEDVFCTVGTHPNHALDEPEASPEQLVALARHPKCVAFGEAGLDYHYNHAPKDTAARVFRNHIAAARMAGLPLVIHTRDADEDCAKILREEMGQGAFTALLHCFTASQALADTAVELGLYISFSGVVTFKNSQSSARRGRQPAAGAHPGRDRRAVSGPDAASRQAQRAGLRRRDRAALWRGLRACPRPTSPPRRPPMRCGCSPKCRRCAKRNAPRDARRHDSRL